MACVIELRKNGSVIFRGDCCSMALELDKDDFLELFAVIDGDVSAYIVEANEAVFQCIQLREH